MSAHEDKGKRYIGLLDSARANGSWNELPELIRKVTKHAPNQRVLIQTATAEHYIATYTSQRTSPDRSDSSIGSLRQTLGSVENNLAEEVFQGQTCLSWASWTGITTDQGETIHTSDVVPLFDQYGQKASSAWTKICLLKAVFMRGQTQKQNGDDVQAVKNYRAAAAYIELNKDHIKSIPQLLYWSEQVMSAYSTIVSSSISGEERSKALRTWSALTAKSQEPSSSTYGNSKSHVSRSSVWQIYYQALSADLAQSQQASTTYRARQAAELRAVESSYETVFLRNRKFPKATESNAVVEEWVEQVIRNWQILCGPSWQDSDLGEGGRNAVTRNVLDILYRAAMKTFHSTLILRRLFQVHKSLTEFELAYRCLDTYIELTERARARAAKAGDPSPESDEVMLLVVSEGIEGLCSYGRRKEAQKAFDLATKLEDWLEEIMPDDEDTLPNGHTEPVRNAGGHVSIPPSDEALQVVCRAIGISKAHWAKWTPFSETRTELQSEALVALQKAVRLSEPELSTLYALALLCAETREIAQATRWTKIALQKIAQADTVRPSVAQNRAQCTFWHLMTLLLSSQQDFDTALQSSSATLDSFRISGLGIRHHINGSRNGSVATEKPGAYAADDLECDDLQRTIELQITYLALVELTDGPEAALNHSDELLSLYSALFRRYEVGNVKPATDRSLVPPKSSAGTVKSVKGSIFSRRKPTPSIAPSVTTSSLISAANTEKQTRPNTQASHAPTIQVTDETGKSPAKKHHHLVHRHRDHDHGSKMSPKDHRPQTAVQTTDGTSSASQPINKPADGVITSSTRTDAIDYASPTSTQHDTQPKARQELEAISHNVTLHEKAPPPLGHSNQPPEQDIRLPNVHSQTSSTSPMPRFPHAAAQRHALVVLNKTWLTVATLYRRSHMFEDAREALEEASKAAAKIEAVVSGIDPSARALADAGWGGGDRSSDEVWADVHCSRAELLQTIAKRREEEGTPVTGDNLREIVEQYEHCLMYYPDHHSGVIGLSNILLDYYEKKIDLAKKVDDGRSLTTLPIQKHLNKEEDVLGPTTPSHENLLDPFLTSGTSGEDLRKTPGNLNRIAARDRAYGLLSTLTKLGTSWDSSEAWFALARAQELGGEVDKAKKILWWCLELEDTRPIRHWKNLGCGGYVL